MEKLKEPHGCGSLLEKVAATPMTSGELFATCNAGGIFERRSPHDRLNTSCSFAVLCFGLSVFELKIWLSRVGPNAVFKH